MKRAFGDPESTAAKGKGSGLDVYKYPGKGDMQGTLEITARHADGVITSISENLPVAFPRTPAYKRFGTDYQSVLYSRADCAAKNGIAPLYRDKNGSVEMIEYPAKGMALALDQYGYDVASVQYLSAPPGLPKAPPCVARASKSKPRSANTSSRSTAQKPAKSPLSMK